MTRLISAPTALFWGEDGFLLRLAAHELFQQRGFRATELEASDWRGGETSDLATPSLWGERRALLVADCQSIPEGGARELRAYLEGPVPDTLCILTQVSRGKNPPPIAKAVQAGGGVVKQIAVKRQDMPRWVLDRAKLRGVALTGPGAAQLIAAFGQETAPLDQAVEQLASAFPGRTIGPEEVRSQFRGLGEQQVWDLCDQACMGRLPEALVTLRSLLEDRSDPLLILGGIASRVRDLLRVRALPDRMPAAEAAKAAGLRFDWQVRRYREQAGRMSIEQLVELHTLVVEADRALKGGAPGDVVLTALVAVMAGERTAALDVPVRVGR
jgi:DNA polymerase-3 subunit delta